MNISYLNSEHLNDFTGFYPYLNSLNSLGFLLKDPL